MPLLDGPQTSFRNHSSSPRVGLGTLSTSLRRSRKANLWRPAWIGEGAVPLAEGLYGDAPDHLVFVPVIWRSGFKPRRRWAAWLGSQSIGAD